MPALSRLSSLDLAIVAAFFLISLAIGIYAGRSSGRSSREFFLSGQNMPWWLLGVSMVATTFAIDTPNLVTDIVRKNGVSGNWVWWAFLISGMVTVYVFAKLWRRAGVMTDVEFYELRYSGKEAAFLRGFRALYLGLIFNVLVMGNVCLAAVKFGQFVLGVEPWQMLLVCGVVVMIYSSIGGLKGVILTDFVQFILAMIGSVWAAIVLIGHEKVGGLGEMLATPAVAERLHLMPDMGAPDQWIPMLLIPLAVVWWSSYYPGSEPGGGGYIAQRMLSAKDERNSMGAVLFFNIAHYALRPWPWILIALASLLVFPSTDVLQEVFPDVKKSLIGDDAAYPAMLTLLPAGLLGLVTASLLAAFMSTMSTQVNLGASYLVNDFYRRFIKPEASEKELVLAGRVASVITLTLGSLLGLVLKDAGQAFKYMLLIGAGTGGIYILRWFWWRINAQTEIAAMILSLLVASAFTFGYDAPDTLGGKLTASILPVLITTGGWVLATFYTRPTSREQLLAFYKKVQPGGPGWKAVRDTAAQEGIDLTEGEKKWDVPIALISAVLGCFTVYGSLFTAGYLIYGKFGIATAFLVGTLVLGSIQFKLWSKLSVK